MENFIVNLPEWAISSFWFFTGALFYSYGVLISFLRIRASERAGGNYPRPVRKLLSFCSWVGFVIGLMFYINSRFTVHYKEELW